ncbi:MEDS domain-containing protein [Streptomyces sp. ST2-7A]|uniref:MEDS domain-containing protein n=1 Tax=Streptomyces sp. ST2-7A TaxID=2907214 RepID=UPI001F47FD7F|nr:MEDS domain-containing protein [Streptomyces sp. ST2-7A]MCE7083114.1 MEDS domain-containing protein [Streptomyces sp. ST2-7A]
MPRTVVAGSSGTRPGDNHLSAVFSDDATRNAPVVRFPRPSFEQRERMGYFVESTPPEAVLHMLEEHGFDATGARERGQLSVVAARDAYFPDGPFDPDRMVEQWHRSLREAERAGFGGLRAIGEMPWCGPGVPGSERLLEYEPRVHHEIFERLPSPAALCLYDLRLIPDAEVALLAGVHPGHRRLGNEELGPPTPRVAPLPDRAGLVLDGEVNQAVRHVVTGAAAALTRFGDDVVELDLSEPRYIDLDGAVRLVAAATREPGSRLVVVGPPPSPPRLLEVFPELSAAPEVVSR